MLMAFFERVGGHSYSLQQLGDRDSPVGDLDVDEDHT